MKLFPLNHKLLILPLILFFSCNEDAQTPNADADAMEQIKNPPAQDEMPDFSGQYKQVDYIGRPETTLNYIIDGADQDKFNQIPATEQSAYQPVISNRLQQMHSLFGTTYETNYLGLDLIQFTTLMSKNVLQVSLKGPTSYADLTGRTLNDDVIDIMLSQMFGGKTGDRFNGQDTDSDGTPDLPILVSDNRNDDRVNPSSEFPYLELPIDL